MYVAMYYSMTIELFSYVYLIERILWLSYSMGTRLWLHLLRNYIVTWFQTKLFLYKLITGNSSYALSVHNNRLCCSCPIAGVRWWSVLVMRRLSHVLILVSYYHCVISIVWSSDLLSPDLGHVVSWWCASVSTSTCTSVTAEENWLVHTETMSLWLIWCLSIDIFKWSGVTWKYLMVYSVAVSHVH